MLLSFVVVDVVCCLVFYVVGCFFGVCLLFVFVSLLRSVGCRYLMLCVVSVRCSLLLFVSVVAGVCCCCRC